MYYIHSSSEVAGLRGLTKATTQPGPATSSPGSEAFYRYEKLFRNLSTHTQTQAQTHTHTLAHKHATTPTVTLCNV